MARIILLGAGFGGISMAYELKEAGDFPGSEISQRCPVMVFGLGYVRRQTWTAQAIELGRFRTG